MADAEKFPAWGYREGEARLFEDGELPEGWVDSPAKVPGRGDDAAEEKPRRGRKPKAEETEAGE